jgi:hypothetical protein
VRRCLLACEAHACPSASASPMARATTLTLSGMFAGISTRHMAYMHIYVFRIASSAYSFFKQHFSCWIVPWVLRNLIHSVCVVVVLLLWLTLPVCRWCAFQRQEDHGQRPWQGCCLDDGMLYSHTQYIHTCTYDVGSVKNPLVKSLLAGWRYVLFT